MAARKFDEAAKESCILMERELILMIIREQADAFVLIAQHDHGFVSGEFAQGLKDACYGEAGDGRREDTVLAAYEHDRSWIGLDAVPLWNDQANRPYSFMDYPLAPKLGSYRKGLDELERMNPYAALLASLHYASFFVKTEEAEGEMFYRHERERQKRLRDQIQTPGGTVERHFKLLQLCDDLSLYVCLNEPGTAKEAEHPWFRSGFARSEAFHSLGDRPLVGRWLDERTMTVDGTPFREAFVLHLRSKRVAKDRIAEHGIALAYAEAPWTMQEIRVE
ncbi:DUF3891 family protein [Paenibacillus filicis]|uniref:DUF3891 family protein n=1 Tax=Paenibacillus gyeongsangnamensis TaxID=3388067 RepID=A0ABT4Q767_9BACL|nr:DUF3891 family protein [Paenibacillus filicis]MCZ8512708.1 DUF3891 family protein [Paenibacillus filicis]